MQTKFDIKLRYVPTGNVSEEVNLSTREKAIEYMKGAFDEYPMQEQLWGLLLDVEGKIMGRYMMALGTATQVGTEPTELFRIAVVAGATRIILFHNHPGHVALPSPADKMFTHRMVRAGAFLDIMVVDHIIIGSPTKENEKGYYSMREDGDIQRMHDLAAEEMSRIKRKEGRIDMPPILKEIMSLMDGLVPGMKDED